MIVTSKAAAIIFMNKSVADFARYIIIINMSHRRLDRPINKNKNNKTVTMIRGSSELGSATPKSAALTQRPVN